MSGIRTHALGGIEFDLAIHNPTDTPADAQCTVNVPGSGHSVTVGSTDIPPLSSRTVTTRMEHLSNDTGPGAFDTFCVLAE